MSMSDKELESIVNNEIEWRKQLWKKVERVEDDFRSFESKMLIITTTLKVKIGLFGTVFGFIGGALTTIIAELIKRKF